MSTPEEFYLFEVTTGEHHAFHGELLSSLRGSAEFGGERGEPRIHGEIGAPRVRVYLLTDRSVLITYEQAAETAEMADILTSSSVEAEAVRRGVEFLYRGAAGSITPALLERLEFQWGTPAGVVEDAWRLAWEALRTGEAQDMEE